MKKYVNEWIVNITDITEEVIEIRNSIQSGTFSESMLPKEKKYIGEHFKSVHNFV